MEEHIGESIRDLRKAKRIRQKTLARVVGISPDALDSPMAYFLGEDSRSHTRKIPPGDPREKRLIEAWRSLGKLPTLRADS